MPVDPNAGVGEALESHYRRARDSGQWEYMHPVPTSVPVRRDEYLEQLVRGRRVVHVGCAAAGQADEQIARDRHLFHILERSAAAQLGVDPDEGAMETLRCHFEPKWPLQACRLDEVPPSLLDDLRPEYVMLPEVLEHVADAGGLLRDALRIAERYDAEIVVTVPGTTSINALRAWLDGFDYVHPDHVASYTPRNLQTLLEKCGLDPLRIVPYCWNKPKKPLTLAAKLKRFVRSPGSPRERALAVVTASLAHRFPDGWIGHARPVRASSAP